MEDIPKSVILVLLVITVLVSVLGTWTVMDQLSGSNIPVEVQSAGETPVGGRISFHPIDPNSINEEESLLVKDEAAVISLGFEEPKEEN